MKVKNICGEAGGKFVAAGESGDDGVVYHYAIVLEDTTLSVLEQGAYTDKSSVTALAAVLAKTYDAGSVIYGQINAITVSTGLLQLVEWDNLGVN